MSVCLPGAFLSLFVAEWMHVRTMRARMADVEEAKLNAAREELARSFVHSPGGAEQWARSWLAS